MSRALHLSARWIVPVSTPPIHGGALLVDSSGRIAALGPAGEVPQPDDARKIDLGNAALVPGLVDAHAHPDLTCLRGALEDLKFPSWIAGLKAIRFGLPLSDDDLTASARLGCIEMIRAGVTSVGATEDSGGSFTALRESGLRGVVYREVFGPDPTAVESAMAGLREKLEAMRSAETDLVRAGVSPHSPVTVSDALFAEVARFARVEGLPVAVHTAESAAERDLVVNGDGVFAERLKQRGIATPARGRSAVDLLDRTGLLDLAPLLIHCVTVDRGDIERIVAAGAAVVHCPVANARLGHGVAPVIAMIDAGITVALGSDSVVSNNRIDMLEEARAAQLFQRVIARSATALPAVEVLRMATLEGARALGLESITGDLRTGLDADICAIRLDGSHVRPVHDPVTAIVHSARASDVAMTAVRGRILFHEGAVLSVDSTAISRAAEDVANRVRAFRGPDAAPAPHSPVAS